MAVVTECRSCDRPVPTQARFCGGCGARVGDATPPTTDRPGGRGGLIAPSVASRGHGRSTEQTLDAPPRRWPAALLLGAVILGLVVAQGLREPPPVDHEPRGYTARGEATRTGVVSLAPVRAPSDEAWRHPIDAPRSGLGTAHAGEAGIAVPSDAGVTLHDSADGSVVWHRTGAAAHQAVVIGERVITKGWDRVTAYDAATGGEVWRLPGVGASSVSRVGPDVLVNVGGDVLALHDAATGEELWRRDLREHLGASLRRLVAADDAGIVAVISRPAGLVRGTPANPLTHHLVGLDRGGDVRWELDHEPDDDAAVVGGAGVLVTRTDTTIVARDLPSLTPRWTTQVPSPGTVRILRADSRTGVVAVAGDPSPDGRTRLLSLDAGEEIARVDGQVATMVSGGPVVLTGEGLTATDADGRLRWRAPLMPRERPAPAVRDGLLYVAGREGLTVRDATDGASVRVYRAAEPWTLRAGLDPPTPVVSEDTIVASPAGVRPGQGGPSLLGLERETAVLAWTRTRDTAPPRGPLTLAGALAYIPVGDQIHGYHVESGRRAFAAEAGSPRGAVAVGDDVVVAGPDPSSPHPGIRGTVSGPGDVVAIHRPTRLEAWRAEMAACTPPVITDDLVVVGTADGVAAVTAADGEAAWAATSPLPVCRELAVADGVVMAATDTRTITSLRVADGSVAWTTTLDGAVTASPAVAGAHLLVPTLDGVTALAVADGTVAWRTPVDGGVASSPVVAEDGVVVVSGGGELVALTP